MLTAEKDARLARERRNEEWKRLSELVRVAMQAGDLQSLQSAYQQQANILFVEGRPHLHVAQLARRTELMHLLDLDVAEVKAMTAEASGYAHIVSRLTARYSLSKKLWRRCPYPVHIAPMVTNKTHMVAAAAAHIARSFLSVIKSTANFLPVVAVSPDCRSQRLPSLTAGLPAPTPFPNCASPVWMARVYPRVGGGTRSCYVGART